MDDHHIQVVQAHLLQRCVDAGLGGLVGLVLGGHLGHDEQLLAGHAAAAHALAHAALVAVSLRRIKVAVAQLGSGLHGLGCVCIVDEPGAQTQLRNFYAVCQRQSFSVHFQKPPVSCSGPFYNLNSTLSQEVFEKFKKVRFGAVQPLMMRMRFLSS